MVGLKEGPYTLADEMWTDGVTKWSSVEFPTSVRYRHLMNREKLKAYKGFAIEAYNYFVSGWVGT